MTYEAADGSLSLLSFPGAYYKRWLRLSTMCRHVVSPPSSSYFYYLSFCSQPFALFWPKALGQSTELAMGCFFSLYPPKFGPELKTWVSECWNHSSRRRRRRHHHPHPHPHHPHPFFIVISNHYFFLTDSTSRQAKICTMWHKLPWS